MEIFIEKEAPKLQLKMYLQWKIRAFHHLFCHEIKRVHSQWNYILKCGCSLCPYSKFNRNTFKIVLETSWTWISNLYYLRSSVTWPQCWIFWKRPEYRKCIPFTVKPQFPKYSIIKLCANIFNGTNKQRQH